MSEETIPPPPPPPPSPNPSPSRRARRKLESLFWQFSLFTWVAPYRDPGCHLRPHRLVEDKSGGAAREGNRHRRANLGLHRLGASVYWASRYLLTIDGHPTLQDESSGTESKTNVVFLHTTAADDGGDHLGTSSPGRPSRAGKLRELNRYAKLLERFQ